jgi:flagellar L-ring protein FlgH
VTVNGVPILETELERPVRRRGRQPAEQPPRRQHHRHVVARLPNGNLVVRGQKWLQLNQGKEFVRIEGVVRPIDIEPDNSMPSWKVADAKIAYGGKRRARNANQLDGLARALLQLADLPF